jgi:thioredoxin 1
MPDHSTITDQPVLIEVTAAWCHVCRAMKPDLDRVASAYQGRVERQVVDAGIEVERVASLGVRGTPTLIGLRRGEEVFRHTGRIGPAELDRLMADLVTDRPVTVRRDSDTTTRLVAGAVLLAVGIVASTPILLGVGVATVAWGLVGWHRQR